MPTWSESHPKPKPFQCSTAWHLQNTGLGLAIYDVIGGITAGGKRTYFTSIKRMSQYLGRDYSSVQKAFENLRHLGWLEWEDVLDKSSSDIKKYRYIPHELWAGTKENAEQCCKRELLPWQEQQADPLVRQLYAIAEGKVRIFEYQVAGLRKLAEGDDMRVLEMFQHEMAAAKADRAAGRWSGTSPKQCLYRVRQALQKKRNTR
jgi:hypothetical protein